MNRSAAPTPLGTVLSDRYELVRHLGRGGMADVYEATDRMLERPVAVKVFRAASPVDGARFATETRVMASLNHPSLVGVYDAGEHDGDGYLVLELVDGQDLRSILDERGRLPSNEVVGLGADLADALDHVHRAGVVHRDVNPSNILCGGDGRPRLTDFGIARLLDTTRVTAVADTIGTAGYMAPEQVRGDDVGPPTDIYALGLVLREALTGTVAFDGERHEAAIARLARDPDTTTGVPSEWQPLLRDMTAREPGDRPTAATVCARLRSAGTASPGVTGIAALPAAAAAAAMVPDGEPTTRLPTAAPSEGDGLATTETVPAAGGTAVMPAAHLAGMADPVPPPGPDAPATSLAASQARRLLVAAAVIVAVLFTAVLMAEERGGLDAPPTTSTAPVVASTTTTAAPAPPPPPEDDDKDDEKKDDEKKDDEGRGNGTEGRDN